MEHRHIRHVLKLLILGIAIGLPMTGRSARAQMIQRQINSSVTNNFSYQIVTTIGTRTSASVSGNLRAETEAILNLRPGSLITNKIGDESGNASAVFNSSPTGANVNLSGITGQNLFIIEEGPSFRTKLTTIDNADPNVSSVGEAASTAVQSTSVSVESGTSSLINTFQQAF